MTPAKPGASESDVKSAFAAAKAKHPNSDWVSLVDLRPQLGGTRAEQDATLKAMSRAGKLHIVPEDNRKALTQADHDASIHVGGDDNHLVMLA